MSATAPVKDPVEVMIDHFIEDGGLHCPFCGSDQLEGDEYDMVGFRFVGLQVRCLACDHRWQNVYKLTGIADID